MRPATVVTIGAIRRLNAALRQQKIVLEAQGWRIIPVPSLPDMHRSINYLNGVHDRTQFLMPAWGGFYRELDIAAAAAFRQALGDEVEIVPLQCADSQLTYGAIHCMVSTFPRATSLEGPE